MFLSPIRETNSPSNLTAVLLLVAVIFSVNSLSRNASYSPKEVDVEVEPILLECDFYFR